MNNDDEERAANLRALDVALNGEDRAAERPLLIDILAQVQQVARERGRPVLAPLPDTVRLVGVKADGSEHDLGEVRMPSKMKAREIVLDMIGPIDEEAGNDAAVALWCCEKLIEWMENER